MTKLVLAVLCSSFFCNCALSQLNIPRSKKDFAVKALDPTGKDVGTFDVDIACTPVALIVTAKLTSEVLSNWVFAEPDQLHSDPWKTTSVKLGARMPTIVNSGESSSLQFVFNGAGVDKNKSSASFLFLLGQRISGMISLGSPEDLFRAETFDATTMAKQKDGQRSPISLRFRTDTEEFKSFKASCLDPVQAHIDENVRDLDAEAKSISANLVPADRPQFYQNIEQYKQAAARGDEQAKRAIEATLRSFFRGPEHTRCVQGDKSACAASDAWPNFSGIMSLYFTNHLHSTQPRSGRTR